MLHWQTVQQSKTLLKWWADAVTALEEVYTANAPRASPHAEKFVKFISEADTIHLATQLLARLDELSNLRLEHDNLRHVIHQTFVHDRGVTVGPGKSTRVSASDSSDAVVDPSAGSDISGSTGSGSAAAAVFNGAQLVKDVDAALRVFQGVNVLELREGTDTSAIAFDDACAVSTP